MKEIGEENARLRKRNGQLLIENSDLYDEIQALKKGAPLRKPEPATRPQTAAARMNGLGPSDLTDSEIAEVL